MKSVSPVAFTDVVLPASSLAVTATSKAPSTRGATGVAEKLPSSRTMAVIVCSFPSASVIVMDISLPAGKSEVPLISGNSSLVTSMGFTSIVGGVVSTKNVSDTVTVPF